MWFKSTGLILPRNRPTSPMKEGHETWRWFWKGQIQELKTQDAQKNTWRQQLRGNRRRNNRYQTMNQASTEQSPDHAKLEDLAPRPTRTWSTPSQQIDTSDYKCSTWSQPWQNNDDMQNQQTCHETQVQEIQHYIPNKYQNSKLTQRRSNNHYGRKCKLLTSIRMATKMENSQIPLRPRT